MALLPVSPAKVAKHHTNALHSKLGILFTDGAKIVALLFFGMFATRM